MFILICQPTIWKFLCHILIIQLESLWRQKRSFLFPFSSFLSILLFHEVLNIPLCFCSIQVILNVIHPAEMISSFPIPQVTSLLNRMQLHAERSASGNNQWNINVLVPPTRSDVLHPCDVMEVLILIDRYSMHLRSSLS